MDPQIGTKGFGPRTDGFRQRFVPEECQPPAAQDAGLLRGYLFNRVTQPFLMVERDRGNQGQVGVQRIHCIKPPTKTYFQEPGVAARFSEADERRKGAKLEIG